MLVLFQTSGTELKQFSQWDLNSSSNNVYIYERKTCKLQVEFKRRLTLLMQIKMIISCY